ncbi:MAG: WD40 repeat domain-containing serine/threonine-protein kinase [bacterium]|nr:WD40 repeat domain-containing serine/threonine-protein kinase [bacterium]
MSEMQPKDISIFLEAIEKESDELESYLADACGGDEKLRAKVEALLAAHRKDSEFLEIPAAELLESKHIHSAVLETGLAPTFGPDAAVVIGSTGHSVLKSLSKKLSRVPQVTLHDSREGQAEFVKPKSPEIPDRQSDSRYQLQGEIARGGMGAIIKGRDTDLGRELAIKVLLDSHKDRPEIIERFVEEAQIGGQLQHPGIVPVYELGQFPDERPFFTMKLIKGQTLAAILLKRKSPGEDWPKLLGIFEQVCQTMAYAHSKGVIHRDLKPANIMVGAFGEVQVMDWGLSKVLRQGGVADEEKSIQKHREATVIQTRRSTGNSRPGTAVGSDTRYGSIMGTPAYMPPEQALGEVDQLDTRADVFGLGAILAEILTGLPPYVAENTDKLIHMARRGQLDECFQRLDSCSADGELIEIAKQALAVNVEERFADAGELQQSITKHLEGVQDRLRRSELEKVEAHTLAREERRRKKLYVAIAGLLLALVSGAGIVATVVGRQQERFQASLDARKILNLNSESAHYRGRNPVLAGLLAIEAVQLANNTPELKTLAESSLLNLAVNLQGPPLSAPEQKRVAGPALSPNERWLVAGGKQSAFLWDLSKIDQPPMTLESTLEEPVMYGSVYGTFTGDNRFVVTSIPNGDIQLWELGLGGPQASPIVLHTSQEKTPSLATSQDGRWLAAEILGGGVRLWDLSSEDIAASSREIRESENSPATGNSPAAVLAFSHNSRRLAVAEGWGWSDTHSPPSEATIVLWDLPGQGESIEKLDSEPPIQLLGQEARVSALQFASDDSYLISGSRDKQVRLWSLDAESQEIDARILATMGREVIAVATSDDGRWLAAAALGGEVALWPVVDGSIHENERRDLVHTPEKAAISRDSASRLLAFDRQGNYLFRGGRRWDLNSQRSNLEFIDLKSAAMDAVLDRHSSRLFTTEGDSIRIWDLTLDDPNSERILEGGNRVVFDPQAQWICVAKATTHQLILYRFDNKQGRAERRLVLDGYDPRNPFFAKPVFSADGRWLAASDGGKVNLWDLSATDTASSRTQLPEDSVKADKIVFAPDNELLITGSSDGNTCIFDLSSPLNVKLLRVISHTSVAMHTLPDVSPDSRWLVNTLRPLRNPDGKVQLWDLDQIRALEPDDPLEPVRELDGFPSINVSAFSPDGRQWVAGSGVGTIFRVSLDGGDKPDVQIKEKAFPLALGEVRIGGNYAAFVGWNSPVQLLDLNEESSLKFIEFPSPTFGYNTYGSLSQDGRILAVSSEGNHPARIWDTSDPGRYHTIEIGGEAMDLSSDGRWLLCGGPEAIRIYDLNIEAEIERTKRLCGRELTNEERKSFGLMDGATR